MLVASCTRPVTTSDVSTTKSSSDTTRTQVSVNIPASNVSVNFSMDSLARILKQTGKPVYIPAKDGRAELTFYLDAMGKLTANCAAKDTTLLFYQTLIKQMVERDRTIVQEEQETAFGKLAKDAKNGIFWILLAAAVVGAIIFTRRVT